MLATDKETVTEKASRKNKWHALERFLIHLLIILTLARWVVDFLARCF